MIGFLIFWPLVASLALFALRPQNAKVLAFVASLVELVASLLAIVFIDHSGGSATGHHYPLDCFPRY